MLSLLKPIYISIKPAIFTGILCFGVAHLLACGRKKIDFQRPRLGCLDGLRGYLALAVVMTHYAMSYNYLLTNKWSHGSALYAVIGECSVALFFMISGFLFWHRLLLPEKAASWGRFFVGRILRLTPVYWFSVAVNLTILLIFKQIDFEYSLSSILKQILLWLLYYKFPTTAAFPFSSIMASGASWTLKYEWIFYLTLPLLGLILKLNKILRVYIFTALSIGAIYWAWKSVAIPGLEINTFFFIYFLFGIAAACLYQNRVFREWSCSKTASLIAFGSLAFLLIKYKGAYEIPQTFLLAIFFIPISMGNSLFGFLKLPASLLLGEISYSVYLLHGVLLYVVYSCFQHVGGLANRSVFEVWGGMIGLGVLTVIFSLGSYLVIEKPFIRLGKKIFS